MKRSTALLLVLSVIGLLAGINAHFIFREPYYEFWDSAANSLAILRAKHFAQIYGPYSRFGFYHPGAGYFYVDALGEWLFYDALHFVPAPFNGQLLIHLCLTAGLFVAGLEVITHWVSAHAKWTFVCVALALAILHFGAMGKLSSFVNPLGGPTAFLSNWSAHFLVLPFFCLLAAASSVAAGRARDLPLLVIAGGFLVHAHVAQPLFVGPMALLAYGGLLARTVQRRRATATTDAVPPSVPWLTAPWREHPRAHWMAVATLAIFLLPLAIDVFRGHGSNLVATLRYLHTHQNEHKTFARSVAYFVQFATYTSYRPGSIAFGHYDLFGFLHYLQAHWLLCAGWLLIVGLLVRALFWPFWISRRQRIKEVLMLEASSKGESDPKPIDPRLFLSNAAGFTILATGLSLYWGTRQQGEMYYYNSWYNFGISYFVILLAAVILCGEHLVWRPPTPADQGTQETRNLTGRVVGVAVVLLTAYFCTPQLRIYDRYVGDNNQAMHESIRRAIAVSDGTDPKAIKILLTPLSVWSQGVAVGLELARMNKSYVVPENWKITFGEDHAWNSLKQGISTATLQPWYIDPPGAAQPAAPEQTLIFPLHPGVSLRITPATLTSNAGGDPATIDFAKGGNAESFILGGWSGQEGAGRWSDQSWAALCFRPQAVQGTHVEMTLLLLPFVDPIFQVEAKRQRLAVYYNGQILGEERAVKVGGPVAFTIPATLWNAAAMSANPLATLEFAFPDAVSPASQDMSGRNQDRRQLGAHFYNIQFKVEP